MLDYLEYGDKSPTTLWEFESQIPTRQVGVIDHFTIGPSNLDVIQHEPHDGNWNREEYISPIHFSI